MDLKYALQTAAADLAYVAQIAVAITRQATSIKTKAQSAQTQALSNPQMDSAFFLSKELFDIDPAFFATVNASFDVTKDRLKRLHSTPFGNTSPAVIGPYYRNWGTNVNLVSINAIDITTPPSSIDGVVLTAGMRVLLVNQANKNENGIYTITVSPVTFTRTAIATDNLEFGTFKVTQGTRFTNTYWWCTDRNDIWFPCSFYPLKTSTVTEPGVLTGDALQAAKSHAINSINYYTVVLNVADTLYPALVTACTNFLNSVNTLKASTTVADVITNATDVESKKTALDTAISNFKTPLYNLEFLADFYAKLVPTTGFYTAEDRQSESRAGYLGAPYRPIDAIEATIFRDKTYNNSFTKSQGDGSGGASASGGAMTGNSKNWGKEQLQVMYDHNAILEYWSQIGWKAAERATNFKSYVELLEQDLIGLGLEEIPEMHDKAVKNTYEGEVPQPTGFLYPNSPKPESKYEREMRDKELSWTQQELEDLDP